MQLKQFQKSGKNSPKTRDSKASKKHIVDTSIPSKDTIHSEVIDTTNTSSEAAVDPVVLNSVTDSDNKYSSEPGVTVIGSNQVTEEIDKEETPVAVSSNQALGETGYQQSDSINQSVTAQVCIFTVLLMV